MDLRILGEAFAVVISFFLVLLVLLLFHIKSRYNYWKKYGVPSPEHEFFFGNLKKLYTFKKSESELLYEYSCRFKDDSYYGIYSLWKPVVVVKDLELAKSVMETNFESFTDRPEISGTTKTDSVVQSLFTMNGEVWRTRRNAMTRLFTPMKLKEYGERDMCSSLVRLMNRLEEALGKSDEVELFDLTEDYPVHCFAASMYGLDLTGDEVRSAQLGHTAKYLLRPPKWNVIKVTGYHLYPKLFNALRITSIPNWHYQASTSFAEELLERRNKDSGKRNDMVTIVSGMLKEGIPNVGLIDRLEAVGHFYMFLNASVHTTQVTLCHVLYQIAQHPQVQENIRNEICTEIRDIVSIKYEEIQRLAYLENTISETLRLYPTLANLKRVCLRDHKVDDRLTIKKGMDVIIDTTFIHRDERYFHEPEKFKPERFSSGDDDLSAYMPFGKGLRTCIGLKMAIIELKLAIASIVFRYHIYPSQTMKLPIKYDPTAIVLSNVPVDGLFVKMKRIKQL